MTQETPEIKPPSKTALPRQLRRIFQKHKQTSLVDIANAGAEVWHDEREDGKRQMAMQFRLRALRDGLVAMEKGKLVKEPEIIEAVVIKETPPEPEPAPPPPPPKPKPQPKTTALEDNAMMALFDEMGTEDEPEAAPAAAPAEAPKDPNAIISAEEALARIEAQERAEAEAAEPPRDPNAVISAEEALARIEAQERAEAEAAQAASGLDDLAATMDALNAPDEGEDQGEGDDDLTALMASMDADAPDEALAEPAADLNDLAMTMDALNAPDEGEEQNDGDDDLSALMASMDAGAPDETPAEPAADMNDLAATMDALNAPDEGEEQNDGDDDLSALMASMDADAPEEALAEPASDLNDLAATMDARNAPDEGGKQDESDDDLSALMASMDADAPEDTPAEPAADLNDLAATMDALNAPDEGEQQDDGGDDLSVLMKSVDVAAPEAAPAELDDLAAPMSALDYQPDGTDSEIPTKEEPTENVDALDEKSSQVEETTTADGGVLADLSELEDANDSTSDAAATALDTVEKEHAENVSPDVLADDDAATVELPEDTDQHASSDHVEPIANEDGETEITVAELRIEETSDATELPTPETPSAEDDPVTTSDADLADDAEAIGSVETEAIDTDDLADIPTAETETPLEEQTTDEYTPLDHVAPDGELDRADPAPTEPKADIEDATLVAETLTESASDDIAELDTPTLDTSDNDPVLVEEAEMLEAVEDADIGDPLIAQSSEAEAELAVEPKNNEAPSPIIETADETLEEDVVDSPLSGPDEEDAVVIGGETNTADELTAPAPKPATELAAEPIAPDQDEELSTEINLPPTEDETHDDQPEPSDPESATDDSEPLNEETLTDVADTPDSDQPEPALEHEKLEEQAAADVESPIEATGAEEIAPVDGTSPDGPKEPDQNEQSQAQSVTAEPQKPEQEEEEFESRLAELVRKVEAKRKAREATAPRVKFTDARATAPIDNGPKDDFLDFMSAPTPNDRKSLRAEAKPADASAPEQTTAQPTPDDTPAPSDDADFSEFMAGGRKSAPQGGIPGAEGLDPDDVQ